MRIDHAIEGLTIIAKYTNDYCLAAEPDLFYCGSLELQLTDYHRKRLLELGFLEFKDADSWGFFT